MFEVEVILLIKYDTWSYLSMCHENKMGAAKEQHPYIICRLDKQKWWNSSGTVTRPLFSAFLCTGLLALPMIICYEM